VKKVSTKEIPPKTSANSSEKHSTSITQTSREKAGTTADKVLNSPDNE
jgi:hypothetical protein